jgi:hypothetical protein
MRTIPSFDAKPKKHFNYSAINSLYGKYVYKYLTYKCRTLDRSIFGNSNVDVNIVKNIISPKIIMSLQENICILYGIMPF